MKLMTATEDYQVLDLRGENLPTISIVIFKIDFYRREHPAIRRIIIDRTQQEILVRNDPVLYSNSLKLSAQLNKPIGDLDFTMYIEGCEVVVE